MHAAGHAAAGSRASGGSSGGTRGAGGGGEAAVHAAVHAAAGSRDSGGPSGGTWGAGGGVEAAVHAAGHAAAGSRASGGSSGGTRGATVRPADESRDQFAQQAIVEGLERDLRLVRAVSAQMGVGASASVMSLVLEFEAKILAAKKEAEWQRALQKPGVEGHGPGAIDHGAPGCQCGEEKRTSRGLLGGSLVHRTSAG